MTDDDDLLAAEFALGLLTPDEAATVGAHVARDDAFAARVIWWQERLSPLAEEAAVAPDDGVWTRIAKALPANDDVRAAMQRWRAIAVGAMTVAAALVVMILVRPPAVTSQSQIMLASLTAAQGTPTTIAYDVQAGVLTIAPGTIATPGKDAELWIIPAGGTPRSLGVIDDAHPSHPSVLNARRALIQPGAKFAITAEPKGGAPQGIPTGPVVSAGLITTT